MIIILMQCIFALADPNIVHIQFWGTANEEKPFIGIIEYGKRENHASQWYVDSARQYRMTSEKAIGFVAEHFDLLGLQGLCVLSKYYMSDVSVIDPNKPAPVEPNTLPEPNEPNVLPDPNAPSGYVMCFSDGDNKICHDPNCPYIQHRKTEPIPASKLAEYEPCPICRPDIVEMLKGVTDPNLAAAVREMMKRN